MKVLLLTIIALTSVLGSDERCKPRFHYWKPYYGTIPNDAFVAGIDANGRKNYIVKTIPQDKNFWTVPLQLKSCQKNIIFKTPATDIMIIDEFVEIMCTKNAKELTWSRVNNNTEEILKNCCGVAGGLGMTGGKAFTSYLGKAESNGEVVMGRIYSHALATGVHAMHGNITTKFMENYDILTYDCSNICNV